jgi:hypothetical protein
VSDRGVEAHSIMYHAAADHAAEKHLDWERLSYDVEETYSEHWRRRFWRLWFRCRWVEHIRGDKYWIEMGEENFAALRKGRTINPLLVERVADRLIVGWENLGIILWATDWGLDIDDVIDVLKKINVNHVTVGGHTIEHIWEPLIA